MLTDWALAGRGIVNKPRFDVTEPLASGALVEILPETAPVASSFGCLYPHRKPLDPKVRFFTELMAPRCRQMVDHANGKRAETEVETG